MMFTMTWSLAVLPSQLMVYTLWALIVGVAEPFWGVAEGASDPLTLGPEIEQDEATQDAFQVTFADAPFGTRVGLAEMSTTGFVQEAGVPPPTVTTAQAFVVYPDLLTLMAYSPALENVRVADEPVAE
jgi:hypothetical protein